MAQPSSEFIAGLYYGICQKYATNAEIASIMSVAKSTSDAIKIIKALPKAEVFLNQFHGLSYNWMDGLFCVGEQPSHFQAAMLAQAGVNRFVDLTEIEQDYFEVLPTDVSYYKSPISNSDRNKPDPVEAAARLVLEPLADKQRVYLHCQSGFCRSAIIASVVMAVRLNTTYPLAIKVVKTRRPVAQPQLELLSRTDAEIVVKRLSNVQL